MHIVLGLTVTLIFALLWHFREQPVKALQLNVPSDRYVVAQVDFEYPDEEATEQLKQEVRRDIGGIYRFDPQQLQVLRKALLKEGMWRFSLPGCTYEELVHSAEEWEKRFAQLRFTDQRTMQKVRELDSNPQVYSTSFPQEITFWKALPVQNATDRYILNFLEKHNIKLVEDKNREKNLGKLTQARISEQYTQVEAGMRLISPGETVTSQHMAMLQAMQSALDKQRSLTAPMSIVGSVLFGALFTLLSGIYLRLKVPQLFASPRSVFLLFLLILLTLIVSKGSEYFLFPHFNVHFPVFVPFAAILISVLISYEIALFSSVLLTVILAFALAVNREEFLFVNLIASFVAILCARKIHRRREIFSVCSRTWLSTVPVVFAFALCQGTLSSDRLLADSATTALLLLGTAVLAVGFLPILENLFRVTTDMTLMEYMDPDQELLRRLSVEAPGTYQHSLVVSHLAEAAARAINANDLFCRVSALYHDIGKLFNPHYFTENQLGGFNIHPLLTPQESAQVIISHISEGEILARKKRLPPSFIDVIRQHHGTTLVFCFYHKQLELADRDQAQVDKELFRYPGPKPYSKESAIIMIADTVEAASRSLESFTEESIAEMIDKLIAEKAADGQLSECQLTFEELGTVKKTMTKSLLIANHLRVRYPSSDAAPQEFAGAMLQ